MGFLVEFEVKVPGRVPATEVEAANHMQQSSSRRPQLSSNSERPQHENAAVARRRKCAAPRALCANR
ncbi:MAG TPA: hypothetical protein VGL78_10640 [Solirubrobacteraceae bacterium]